MKAPETPITYSIYRASGVPFKYCDFYMDNDETIEDVDWGTIPSPETIPVILCEGSDFVPLSKMEADILGGEERESAGGVESTGKSEEGGL
jgi:hypothetical protein